MDNGSGIAKQRLRLQVLGDRLPSVRVLECLAGEGGLYRAVWFQAAGGACMDKDALKIERAARERQRWACYLGDSEKALAAGWMGRVPF